MSDDEIDKFMSDRRSRIAFDQLKNAIEEERVKWVRIDNTDQYGVRYTVYENNK